MSSYIGAEPAAGFATLDRQTITGDGGTGYTLDHAVANENEIEVFVNNVRQEPGTAYTVSGTTLTMTGNVAASDDFYVVFQGKALQTVNHPSDQPLSATTGTFTGDLTVDTNTLFVDASADKVGINEATPSLADLEIYNSTAAGATMLALVGESNNTGDTSGYTVRNSILFGGQATTDTRTRIDGVHNRAAALGGELVFNTCTTGGSLTEKGRFLANGGLTFNGDTAAANALDDYEEGTWTPSITAGTITTSGSTYVKVGKMVTVNVYVQAFSNRTSGNHITIGNLPFTSASSVNGSGSVMGRYINNGGDSICVYVSANNTNMSLWTTLKGGNYTGIGHNDLNSASANLFITHTYQSA